VFSCEVTDIPGLEDEVFGSKTRFFSSKKKARIQAAKAAMLHIDENQLALVDSPKKGGTGGGGGGGGKKSGKVALAEPGSTILTPVNASIHETISLICPRLGLSLPEYTYVQDERSPSLYDITAVIRRGPGQKGCRMGPLKGIYGKKKAKDMIADGVLRFLTKEAANRQVSLQTDGS